MKRSTWLTVAAAAALGLALGIGGYTFVYAKGASYLTDSPEACVNCHVMRPQYLGWSASSHRSVAVCNDCHTPSGFFAKYAVKAKNGFWHSFYFTTGRFHEPIQITESNRQVTEQSCRKCHQNIVRMIDHTEPHGMGSDSEGISCIRCHGSVGHPQER